MYFLSDTLLGFSNLK